MNLLFCISPGQTAYTSDGIVQSELFHVSVTFLLLLLLLFFFCLAEQLQMAQTPLEPRKEVRDRGSSSK